MGVSFGKTLCYRGPDRKSLVLTSVFYDRLVHEPFAHVRFTRLQCTCVACYYWMLAQQCLLLAWKAGGPVKEVQAPTCSEVPGLKLSIARRCHSMTLRQIREQLSIGTHIMSECSALVLILSANKTLMHRELSELPLALLLGLLKAQSYSLDMLMYSATHTRVLIFLHGGDIGFLSSVIFAAFGSTLGLAESSMIYIPGYANLLGCVAIITNHGCVFVIYARRFIYLHGGVIMFFYRR